MLTVQCGCSQSMQTALFYAERRKDGLEGEGLEIVRQRRRTHELLAGACPILANKAFPPASASSLDSHSRGGVSQSFPGGQRWDARFGAVQEIRIRMACPNTAAISVCDSHPCEANTRAVNAHATHVGQDPSGRGVKPGDIPLSVVRNGGSTAPR